MSETTCPHCHAETQADGDGQCSACGRSLVVSPLHLDADVKKRTNNWIYRALKIAALLCALVLVVEVVLQHWRGSILSLIYNSIGLIVIPCVFMAKSNLRRFRADGYREPANLPRSAIFVAIGLALYLGLRYWAAQSGSAAIAGTNTPGHYQNDYFNFQLPYGLTWHDVTHATGKQAAISEIAPYLLLGLTLPPTADNATTASVMLTAVKIPSSEAGNTSSDHLDMMVSNLMKRSDHPRDVKIEQRSTLGGIEFDRLSLQRPWGDQEMGMTFWATQQRGYMLLITGSYPTPEGLLAIEELLAKMSEAHNK
ncbi:MAG: hypothetical protein JWP89_6602 [Schlesneria sp.]|nr:hypothetical protein [Schlesneria sp.]